jgi:hypothetical protein
MKKASTLLLAGVAIAGISAAHAAQPAQKHRAAVEAIQANKAARVEAQPRTMAQADQTQFRTRNGGTAVRVPTELWSTLGAAKRADGSIVTTESENTRPAAQVEELPHE